MSRLWRDTNMHYFKHNKPYKFTSHIGAINWVISYRHQSLYLHQIVYVRAKDEAFKMEILTDLIWSPSDVTSLLFAWEVSAWLTVTANSINVFHTSRIGDFNPTPFWSARGILIFPTTTKTWPGQHSGTVSGTNISQEVDHGFESASRLGLFCVEFACSPHTPKKCLLVHLNMC